MATIKSFTSLEQSQKLTEILPHESADMVYVHTVDLEGDEHYDIDFRNNQPLFEDDISAWSLAALLNYLKSKNKFPEIKELSDGRFKLTTYIWDGEDCIQVSIGDIIVDACYEMILKLHERNLL